MEFASASGTTAFVIYSCTVLAVLIFLGVVPAAAAPVRETLGALYQQRDAAASRRDPVGCMAVCAPDYAYFASTGLPQGFAHAQDRLARGYSALRRAHVTTTVQTLTTASDGITVLAQERTEANLTAPSRSPIPVLVVTRNVRDFWVRTSTGTWKMKRRRLLRTSAKVNGVPIRTNLPPPHPLPKPP